MLPLAHIASALLANRLAGVDRSAGPSLGGALVPDAIDKTLAWVLGVAPTARYIGHTPLAAGALSLGAGRLFGRRAATAFGLAYFVHLLGDMWDEGHIPWLMPFKRYDHRGERWHVHLGAADLALEALGAAYLYLSLRAGREGT
jgi:hypothetical protein